MKKEEVLAQLRVFKHNHAEDFGILEIGVFGSIARDGAEPDSDVNIRVRTRTPNPFTLVGIKETMEAILHVPVDVVRLREHMNPYFDIHAEQVFWICSRELKPLSESVRGMIQDLR